MYSLASDQGMEIMMDKKSKVKAEHKILMDPIEAFEMVLWSNGLEYVVDDMNEHLQTKIITDGAEYGLDIVYDPRRKSLVMVQLVIQLIELPLSRESLLGMIQEGNIRLKNRGYFCYLEESQTICWQFDLSFKGKSGVTQKQAAKCLDMAEAAVRVCRFRMLGAFRDLGKLSLGEQRLMTSPSMGIA